MSGTLRISICDPNEKSRENIKNFLVGMDQIWLEADCSRYEFFTEIVGQTTPDVAIIDIDDDDQKALGLIESLSRTYPECGIIVVSQRTDGQMILQAMRAGAREFLNSPLQIDELVGALERVGATRQGGGSPRQVLSFRLRVHPAVSVQRRLRSTSPSHLHKTRITALH